MWTRVDLKTRAKEAIKKNYWAAVVAALLITLFAGGLGGLIGGNAGARYEMSINESGVITDQSGSVTSDTQQAIDSISAVIEENPDIVPRLLIIFLTVFFLTFLVSVLFINVLEVGGCRFFVENREKEQTKVRRIFYGFTKGNWLSVAGKMFFRNLYLFLWTFTIVGVFIKSYEYLMVPYIVAENPKIGRKQAFKLSKEMMRGNKWDAFVLGLSFIGWMILGALTFGIVSIFYVNPYCYATYAELYASLREKAINEKFEYSEELMGM